MTRQRLLAACSILIGFVLAALSAEAALQLMNRFRFMDYWSDRAPPREPTTNAYDPVLGWKPLPGRHVIPAYWPGASDIVVTIRDDGTRVTGPEPNDAATTSVLAIGDSLTLGWALDDQDTFLWRLQARHPDVRFINLGVLGYSTWQAFLRSQEYLRDTGIRPRHVIYPFVEHHEYRNVATSDWQLTLAQYARRGHVSLPYCLERGPTGAIDCFPPAAFPRWPLDKSSQLVNWLKFQYLARTNRARPEQRERVTRALLRRMNAWYAQQGALLHVIFVWTEDDLRARYTDYLRKEGIPSANCVHPRREEPDMRVPGEGHPNAAMNAFLAECIDQHLRPFLPRPAPAGL